MAPFVSIGVLSLLAIIALGVVAFVSGLFAAVFWRQGQWLILPWGALCLLAVSLVGWWFSCGLFAMLWLLGNQH